MSSSPAQPLAVVAIGGDALDHLDGPAAGPRRAVIGRLERLLDLIDGEGGTTVAAGGAPP